VQLFINLKVQILSLKFKSHVTICFGQYGHHQVLTVYLVGKLLLSVVTPITRVGPSDVHVCCSQYVVLLPTESPRFVSPS
jgi:hypothetical protein